MKSVNILSRINMFPWQQHARTEPQNRIALRDHSQGVIFTWAELNDKIQAYRQILWDAGIGLRGVVAIKGKNNLDYLLFYLSSLNMGACVLGLNPAFSAEKITALCEQNDVELLIDCTSSPYQLTRLTPQKPRRLPILPFDPENPTPPDPQLAYLKNACTLTLTSGSTGNPKAIVHNISAHAKNAKGVCELMAFDEQHSWLFSLPLYHVSGQGIVWRWLIVGAELQLPSENFYADAVQATHLSLVPTQAQRLLDFLASNPQRAVNIQHILLGGSHIPVELTQKLTVLGIASYVGYGMTEMASTIFAKKFDGKTGVGKPLQGREFKIVDKEIWLRGAGLARGYWANGKVEPITNAEGWLQTKDLGDWDGENLHILGRSDNMFISGGENIQPEEIERAILQCSSVKQAIVLPVPDAEFGQRPVAVVEFDQTPDFHWQSAVENLKIFLAEKLERFKLPIGYLEMPNGVASGIKVSRKALGEWLALNHFSG